MPLCPRCQTEMTDGSRFCAHCGAPLDVSTSAVPDPSVLLPTPEPSSDQGTEGSETVVLPAAVVPTVRLHEGGDVSEPGRQTQVSDDQDASGKETVVLPAAIVPTVRLHEGNEDATFIASPVPSGSTDAPAETHSSSAAATGAFPAPPHPPSSQPFVVPPASPQPVSMPTSGNRIWLVIAIVGGLMLVMILACVLGIALILNDIGSTVQAPIPGLPTEPAATATRIPSGSSAEILLEENFDDPEQSNMSVGENLYSTFAFQDGFYTITLNRPKYIVWSFLDGTYSDAVAEVEATLEGPAETAAGLIFHYQDEQNFYLFNVSGNQLYSLDLYDKDELTHLLEWTESEAINGPGEPNRLRVETEGAQIRLFVNDELLAELEDETFTEGWMALAVNTFDEGDATVKFDNLLVQENE